MDHLLNGTESSFLHFSHCKGTSWWAIYPFLSKKYFLYLILISSLALSDSLSYSYKAKGEQASHQRLNLSRRYESPPVRKKNVVEPLNHGDIIRGGAHNNKKKHDVSNKAAFISSTPDLPSSEYGIVVTDPPEILPFYSSGDHNSTDKHGNVYSSGDHNGTDKHRKKERTSTKYSEWSRSSSPSFVSSPTAKVELSTNISTSDLTTGQGDANLATFLVQEPNVSSESPPTNANEVFPNDMTLQGVTQGGVMQPVAVSIPLDTQFPVLGSPIPDVSVVSGADTFIPSTYEVSTGIPLPAGVTSGVAPGGVPEMAPYGTFDTNPLAMPLYTAPIASTIPYVALPAGSTPIVVTESTPVSPTLETSVPSTNAKQTNALGNDINNSGHTAANTTENDLYEQTSQQAPRNVTLNESDLYAKVATREVHHQPGDVCFDACDCWPVWSLGIIVLVLYFITSFVTVYLTASLYSKGLFASHFYKGGGYWMFFAASVGLLTGGLIGGLVPPACWAGALYFGGSLMASCLSVVLLGRRGAWLGASGGIGVGGVIGKFTGTGSIGIGVGMVVGLLFGIVIGFAPICRTLKINERYIRAGLRGRQSRIGSRYQTQTSQDKYASMRAREAGATTSSQSAQQSRRTSYRDASPQISARTPLIVSGHSTDTDENHDP